MSTDTIRYYESITDNEISEIAATWSRQGRLERHADRWLARNGFGWHPAKSDDGNCRDFDKIAAAVLDQVL